MIRASRFLILFTLIFTMAFVPIVAQEEEEAADTSEQFYSDVVVVTASRTEQKLHDVPAAITVISSETLETAPVDNYGDVLRNVPGLNITQTSARDINVTARGATSTLASSQLVLVDNRSIYLDFFGFVAWDFLPANPNEIKQIEAVSGPGSAVWGANAMTGVINLITKSPREMQGFHARAGGGELGTLYGGLTFAQASAKSGFKISGNYYESDAYDRPTGNVPIDPVRGVGGGAYPDFENSDTQQPKVDLRWDYDTSDNSTLSLSGGYSGTSGIIHSGIGPFNMDTSTYLGYGKVEWTRFAMRVGFFYNKLNGESQNLLSRGIDGRPLQMDFKTDTYNLDFTNTNVFGSSNIVTYGANARKNEFDITIAPNAEDRDELGAFLQDEILIGDKFRMVLGARWDDFDAIGSKVSPRAAFLFSPNPNHTIRLTYSNAFRSPSTINNYLDVLLISAALDLSPLGGPSVYPVVSFAHGNLDLVVEEIDSYELGYVATFGSKASFTMSIYRNEITDNLDFFTESLYSPTNPPPGWPLPPFFLAFPPLNGLPATFSYRNIGEIVDQGFELGLQMRHGPAFSWFFNYSWQDDSELTGINPIEFGEAPTHRANLGASYNGAVFFANGNANYQDEAYWADVLDPRFYGTTDSFVRFNLTLGVRLAQDKVTLAIIGTNIFDDDTQMHIFGDIISRKVTGEVRVSF